MDRTPEERDLIEYCAALMRVDREFPSLHRMIAEMRGRNWDEERYKPGADDIEKAASEAVASALHNNDPSWFPAGMGDYLRRIAADRLSSRESAGLVRAITGRFVTPACAGDPMRDPGVYPAGRGMYAFDPRLVPTPAAERLLLDDETRERLQRNNPHAAVKIGELLVESERRGYWRPDPGTSARLRDIIISMEADVE